MSTETLADAAATMSAGHRDGVSPTPWRVEKSPANGNFWVVRCDTGVSLATAWREADAAFIVEAVNRFTAHRENAPLPSARGAELSSASRPTGAEFPPAVTAGETASMLLPWTVEGPFPGQRETKKRHGFAAYANIVNRIGSYVAQGLPPEVAAGIVEAVNGVDATLKLQRTLLGWSMERNRLRDIVLRLADALDTFIGLEDHEIDLLREAREALVEDAP